MGICIICNKEFIETGHKQKYCRPACRRKAWKINHRDRHNEQQRRRAKEKVTERLLKTPNRKCIECKKSFKIIDDRRHPYKTFCSSKCRDNFYHKKAYKKQSLQRKLDRQKCGLRNCEFCGKLFDPRKFWYYRTVKTCSSICSRNLHGKKLRQTEEYRIKHNFYQKERKHRMRANGGKFTLQEWEAMKRKVDYTCKDCGRREPEIKLTIDHIKRIKDGGRHEAKNIQPLCVSCNAKKQ